MLEIGKFIVKISNIPNSLEKYMALTINERLVSIDSMQFMNSSLDALVKNLWDNDFEYLFKIQEFRSDLLQLVKQKECIHSNIWTVLKSFSMKNYMIGVNFIGL